jgi:hypothetical protein
MYCWYCEQGEYVSNNSLPGFCKLAKRVSSLADGTLVLEAMASDGKTCTVVVGRVHDVKM